MNIEKAINNERMLKAVTGMTVSEFKSLFKAFSRILTEQLGQKTRKRKVGGGRKGKIKSSEQKLFYLLFYLKVYPTFDLAALIFDSSKTRTNRWVLDFMPLLEKTLGRKYVLPVRRIGSMEEFLQKFPGVKDLFVDGTEREIRRPRNRKNQKKNYSGKKKRHTRKNIVACDEHKKICYLSPTKCGKTHDKKMIDKTGFLSYVPHHVTVWQDTGFQGTQKTHPNTLMPKKKTKKKPLTEMEKGDNRIISSFRIVVEHAIGGIKRFNCVSSPYRNKAGIDDMFMNICSGLWNFHLELK